MRKSILLAALAGCTLSMTAQAQTPQRSAADTSKAASGPKKPGVADKVKGNKKMEGLFTIYQDTATGSTQIYVKKSQLGKKYVYQSFSENGPNSVGLGKGSYRDNAVICIKKYYDRLEFQRMNTRFYFDKNNPVSKVSDINQPEAIFLAEKVIAEDSAGYLVSGEGLFLGEKLDQVRPSLPPGIPPGLIFSLGNLNSAKSQYYKVRSYPTNTDIVVDLAYENPNPFNGGGNDIADARFNRVRIQHSFIEIPENTTFKPRMDDPRVGFFTEEITDLTSIRPNPYHDMIHHWNLQKKDPGAALSEPVEPIVWWIENTTPMEYRDIIKEAGLKWNEAFEKAGFKNAVVMKVQPDDADWDAGDIRYNVIRWVSSPYPSYGAYGPSFVNPLTGQILGADIMVEWFSGSATPIYDEIFSNPGGQLPELEKNPNACTLGKELKMQFTTGLTALETAGAPASEIKEMHKQFLYYLILHEMGHTMGLNHNMKASQMLSPSQLNDKSITRVKGLQGSVMDYPAINISSDRSKQGDYYTTKPGPYDLWAIEFGYTPTASEADEKAFRNKVLSRSTENDLVFGNDADDMRSPGKAIDPRVNVNDMSSDAV
ncbi:MAG TPA: zinc-dependent metalloprotease, partial [Flavisolibacter sp.]|nr:zinc-dependent metalloprotease [Flavisolibacter sp.]